MLVVGDKIKYRSVPGIVKTVLSDMIIVTLEDGKDYSLMHDSVTKDGEAIMTPTTFAGVMTAIRPNLKNMNFLNDLAEEMHKAGVGELSIVNGSIAKFSAKESLAEKLAKYKEQALKEAEDKARKEFDIENQAK
jgi:hypothetical protein